MASNDERYTATIEVNARQAHSELDRLTAEYNTKMERLRIVSGKRSKEAKAEAEQLRRDTNRLNKEIQTQKKYVDGLDKAMSGLAHKTYNDLRNEVRQLNKLMRDGTIEKGSKTWLEMAEHIKRCKEEMQEYENAVEKQESAWGKFTGFLNKNWGALTQIFGAVTGISATIRSAVNDYASMEEEMANVRKYTGMTAEQVVDLNEEFKKIDTRTSREQLNQLAGSAGRLGITSKSAILDFVDAADKIQVALGDDLGEGAIDKVGKLAMAFGEDEKMGLRGAMLATGSAINELAQNSSAQAGYLVDFTARVAGFGKQMGLTQAQILGFGAVMDENMLRDEMASTAFGNMLTKMQTDTAKFAKIAGKDIKEFTRLLNEDANAAILAVADSLRRQDPQTMMKMLDDMGLDGSRAVGVLSTLADKIDDVRERQELATEAYADGTSVVKEFATMNDTAEARMEKVKKAFKEMTIELGERLLPVVKYTISGAGLLAKGLNVLTNFVANNWRAIVTLTSGIVAYQVAINIATIKEKAHAAAIAISNGYIKTKIFLTKAWAVATTAVGLVYDLLTGKIKFATFVQQMHNKVVMANPYVAAAAAVMALVAAVTSLIGRTGELTRAQRALQEVTQQAENDIAGEKAELEALVSTARDKSVSDEVRRQALKKLQDKYPEYLGSLSMEEIYTKNATTAIDNLTDALMAEAKARILVQRIKEAEEEKAKLDDKYFSGISGIWQGIVAEFQAMPNALLDATERALNMVKYQSFDAWDIDTWITENGYGTNPTQVLLNNYSAEVRSVESEISALNKELRETVKLQAQARAGKPTEDNSAGDGSGDGNTGYKTEAEIRKELAERRKRLAELHRQEAEEKRILKAQADAAKASYQEQLACEMLAYRQGLTTYTDYMEEKHNLTQNYYDALKRIYGEDSNEYKKALLQQERDEQEYNQWKIKQKDDRLLQERLEREHNIRMQYAQQNIHDEEALNEALFRSEITYLKQKQNLYQNGSKEWIEIEQQIQQRNRQHQFEVEQNWMERLSEYRQQAGQMDYQRLQEVELKGVESFYGALVESGRLTQAEYDAIVEHIKRKYAELAASQTADNSVKTKAGKALDTAKKAAGVESVSAGNDAATGIFSISQAVSQQKMINEQLKQLYGEDYENNAEYQEAKRQLDAQTMQQIVAGAQAAYSTISSLMSAASSYAQACSDLEVAKITANYDKQIAAAGNNSKKRARLEKERDKEIAKAKTKANEKAMKMEIAQAIAQTAMGAISAYSSTMSGAPYPANLVLAPISAGIALAAGALQIATIKKQHEAEAAGYYEGGFTGGSQYRKEAGVVHEGEFVANHQAVNNRQLLPVFSLLDQAQRNNRVASLRADDVTNALGGPASSSIVAPIVNIQNDNEDLQAGLEDLSNVVATLKEKLDDGIEAYTILDGPNGLYKSLKRYERLISKK
ncbi:MAG: phage tail tape measure protein [Prevotella sp.]|nr:phage tail tape measure protein [Prevotella sp.]MBR1651832.1 phage tail tape measure protein [Alloprevotella sp.]